MDLWSYEKAKQRKDTVFCGIDEAGRGPLCGPVSAAAVILPFGCNIEGLNDSKKLSEKKREALYDIIVKEAAAYAVAFSTPAEIDKYNILNATYLAMKRAAEKLSVKPDFIFVDGNRAPDFGIETETIVKGDAKSANIAAASILAKVTRDRYMKELAEKYPECDVEIYYGGQPIYYYIVSLE